MRVEMNNSFKTMALASMIKTCVTIISKICYLDQCYITWNYYK